jgi:hypothetical protein
MLTNKSNPIQSNPSKSQKWVNNTASFNLIPSVKYLIVSISDMITAPSHSWTLAGLIYCPLQKYKNLDTNSNWESTGCRELDLPFLGTRVSWPFRSITPVLTFCTQFLFAKRFGHDFQCLKPNTYHFSLSDISSAGFEAIRLVTPKPENAMWLIYDLCMAVSSASSRGLSPLPPCHLLDVSYFFLLTLSGCDSAASL